MLAMKLQKYLPRCRGGLSQTVSSRRQSSTLARGHPSAILTKKAEAWRHKVEDEAFAHALDAEDELRQCRQRFHIPRDAGGQDVVYLCGNSLGLQHVDVEASVLQHMQKWREDAVGGHFTQPSPWFEIDEELREPMAALVGAKREEVVLMNSLTVNLHLLMLAFYKPRGRKRKILIEQHPFPSDMWAICSQIRFRGGDPDADLLELGSLVSRQSVEAHGEVPRPVETEALLDVLDAHGEDIALVMLSGVHFLTGQFFDLAAITKKAHAHGCMVGFDLAHAVGNVPLQLHDWGVDFAMWCTYKYLNAGPGNIAGAFIHSDIDVSTLDRLEGWWGHRRENRFALKRSFDASPGVASFQLSNPGVLCMASLKPGLEFMAEVGMERLRAKSYLLTAYLEMLLKLRLGNAMEILTPLDPAQRGCQLSVRVLAALRSGVAPSSEYECGTNTGNIASVLQRQLEEHGAICDNRPPDILRLSPVPLYNTFTDVWRVVDMLDALLETP